MTNMVSSKNRDGNNQFRDGKGQVTNYLKELAVFKSTELNKIHPIVLDGA